MANPYRYKGLHVDAKDGWTHLGDLSDDDNKVWAVYQGRINAKGWSNIKLAARSNVMHKGNYWLAWSGSRLASNTELRKLDDRRPELHLALLDLMDDRLAAEVNAEPDADGYDLI